MPLGIGSSCASHGFKQSKLIKQAQKTPPPLALDGRAGLWWCGGVPFPSSQCIKRLHNASEMLENATECLGLHQEALDRVRMLCNASEVFRMHQNASEGFRMLQIASECFRMHPKALECIKIHQNASECFRLRQNASECIRRLQNALECFRMI